MKKRSLFSIIIILLLVGCFTMYKHVNRTKEQSFVFINTSDSSYVYTFRQGGIYHLIIPFSAKYNPAKMYKVAPISTNGPITSKAIDLPLDITNEEVFPLTIPNVGTIQLMVHMTSVPTLYLTTKSGSMDGINNSKDKSVKEKGACIAISVSGDTLYNGKMKNIKGRGNWSWLYDPKKSYNIHLNEKVKIPGLKKSDKFSLISNYSDKTSLRNYLGLEASRKAGVQFTPHSCFVQVFLNGHYNGLYQMTNKMGIDKSCVDIYNLEKATEEVNEKKLKKYECIQYSPDNEFIDVSKAYKIPNNPTDISGGYLYEFHAFKDSYFSVKNFCTVSLKSPEYASVEQIERAGNLFTEMLMAVNAKDGINQRTGKSYHDYLDISSFAHYYALQETFANMDGCAGSVFIYKDKDTIDTKMHACSMWDLVSALGNPIIASHALVYNAFQLQEASTTLDCVSLFSELYKFQDYKDSVIDFFNCQIQEIVPDYFYGSTYDSVRNTMSTEIYLNNMLWFPNDTKCDLEIEFDNLSNFVRNRMLFLSSGWGVQKNTITVRVNLNYPKRTLIYKIPKGETITLPKMPIVRQEKASEDWYYSGTNMKFDETKPIVQDTEIEMRWHNMSFLDKLRLGWNKREKIYGYIKDYILD